MLNLQGKGSFARAQVQGFGSFSSIPVFWPTYEETEVESTQLYLIHPFVVPMDPFPIWSRLPPLCSYFHDFSIALFRLHVRITLLFYLQVEKKSFVIVR